MKFNIHFILSAFKNHKIFDGLVWFSSTLQSILWQLSIELDPQDSNYHLQEFTGCRLTSKVSTTYWKNSMNSKSILQSIARNKL